LIGFWGRFGVHPLRARNAYFCDYALPNQLGLNPVYTFTISVFEQYREKHNILRLMNDENAIRNVKKFLSIHQRPTLNSPIARKVMADNKHPAVRANVFIVLMESMSADFLTRYGNENRLTPNLDSLAIKGWSFDNFYSSGMHTYQGIFSSLFGLPCILRNHPMLDEDIMSYSGFPNTLHSNGYQTAYFATHEGFRDNVNEFLPANGFDHFFSQEDYPDSEVQGLYGVPDHYLFHYAVGKCSSMHRNGKPFLATLMTGVNHPPYEMPKNIPFIATAEEEQDQFVQYADWAIGEFMKDAAQQSWFDSTIFIFVADHGAAIDKTYDLSLSYHHIPCIFYGPKILGLPRVIDQVGGQIDLFATTMGILNLPYTNNTLGVDLMRQPRKFAYFSEDDKIGCIGPDYLYVLRNNQVETLYHYRDKDLKNYLEEKQALTDSMSTYLKSMLQTTMWMIKNKKVGNTSGD
jgi:phosphoglycerol transferase MdoB-like AlkP superfamily enzyme